MKSNKTSLNALPAAKPAKKSSAAAKPAIQKATVHKHSKLSTPVVAPVAAAPPMEDVANLAHTFWVERNYAHGFGRISFTKTLAVVTC